MNDICLSSHIIMHFFTLGYSWLFLIIFSDLIIKYSKLFYRKPLLVILQ